MSRLSKSSHTNLRFSPIFLSNTSPKWVIRFVLTDLIYYFNVYCVVFNFCLEFCIFVMNTRFLSVKLVVSQ